MSDTDQNKNNDFGFNKPAVYEITVLGELNEKWLQRLGGLKISRKSAKYKKPVSILKGSLKDQSALSGVLNTLYEMHLSVVSVKMIKW
jgi:phosphoserine aminotransferase